MSRAMHYLITADIADPRRLRRVARISEQDHAVKQIPSETGVRKPRRNLIVMGFLSK